MIRHMGHVRGLLAAGIVLVLAGCGAQQPQRTVTAKTVVERQTVTTQHTITTKAATATTTSKVAKPVRPAVSIITSGGFYQEPSMVAAGTGGSVYADVSRWANWGASTATAVGTLEVDDCTPNCAEGTTRYVAATITLSAPDANGEWTVITEAANGRTTTFTLAGHWAQGATS